MDKLKTLLLGGNKAVAIVTFIVLFIILLLIIKFRKQIKVAILLSLFGIVILLATGVINYKSALKVGETKIAEMVLEQVTDSNTKYKNGKLMVKIGDDWVNVSDKIDTANGTVETVIAGEKVAVNKVSKLVADNKDSVKIDENGIKIKQGKTYVPVDKVALDTLDEEVKINNGGVSIKVKNKKTGKDEWVAAQNLNENYTVPNDISGWVMDNIDEFKQDIEKEKNKGTEKERKSSKKSSKNKKK